MNEYQITKRVELAPGKFVHVAVQSWADVIEDRESTGMDEAKTDEEKSAASLAWTDRKIGRLAGMVQVDEDGKPGGLAFETADELRRKLNSAQVGYLLNVMGGKGDIPSTFREWYEHSGEAQEDQPSSDE